VTEFLANNLPKIWIASYSEASQLLTSETGDAIAHIISIGEPGSTPPAGYTQVPHRLRLEFDDIVALNEDEPDYVLATSEHIHQVIDFVPIISQEGGDVLIHCQAGISRSAAIALTIYAILLGVGQEEEALSLVLENRPQAVPNIWIAQLADEALGRNGKLAQVAQMHEDWYFEYNGEI
jgi:predicted protein tyrosine phosphatase